MEAARIITGVMPDGSEHRVVVNADGSLAFVYSDRLASLLKAGDAKVERASHVEPSLAGGWIADMRPSGGPVLYDDFGVPFALRADALAAELAWLREHRGL